jgi:hypothetical protein
MAIEKSRFLGRRRQKRAQSQNFMKPSSAGAWWAKNKKRREPFALTFTAAALSV